MWGAAITVPGCRYLPSVLGCRRSRQRMDESGEKAQTTGDFSDGQTLKSDADAALASEDHFVGKVDGNCGQDQQERLPFLASHLSSARFVHGAGTASAAFAQQIQILLGVFSFGPRQRSVFHRIAFFGQGSANGLLQLLA